METETGPEEVETWNNVFSVAKDEPSEAGVEPLPATFAVLAGDADLDREIVIELEALAAAGGQVLVSRRVRTTFVPGESRLVRMALFRACEDIVCSSGQSCGCAAGAACSVPKCVDETVRAEDMELIDNPGVLPPNPGIPGGGGPPGGGISCTEPLRICESSCINPDSDPRYCGGCETACLQGEVCEAGDCLNPGDCRSNGVGCSGFTYCDEGSGDCVPGCSRSEQCAGAREVCDTSAHECVCAAGFDACDGECVDTADDPRYCGGCQTACPQGNVCEAGNCLNPGDCRGNSVGCSGFTYCDEGSGDCVPGCSRSEQCAGTREVCDTSAHECVCSAGFEACDGECVDTADDPRYCGGCQTACPQGNVCEAGDCLSPNDCRTNGVGCTGLSYCDDGSGDCVPGCSSSAQCVGFNEVCDTDAHECVCTPSVTCSSAGASCGSVDDGCGRSLNCGSCTGGKSCVANQCVCTPSVTCSSAGASCGSVDDGCGRSLNCGSCAGGSSCVANQCVCTPSVTCSSAGASCGSVDDGCGRSLNCGSCAGGSSCVANQCVCTPSVTCSSAGASCGSVDDGCGGTLNCGSCAANAVCGPARKCVCAPSFHLCAGICVSDGDVNACGASCTVCPVPENSTATCLQGVCGFVCVEGFERLDNTCRRCPPGQGGCGGAAP